MTDRISAVMVVLEEDLRADAPRLQQVLTALGMISGVVRVTPVVASPSEEFIGATRADAAWRRRVAGLLEEDMP